MQAWAKDQKTDETGGFITMMGDPSGQVTRALGVVLDHPGPMGLFGYPRSKRFAMILDDGVIKHFAISENQCPEPLGCSDPAGDDYPESSCVEAMLEQL